MTGVGQVEHVHPARTMAASIPAAARPGPAAAARQGALPWLAHVTAIGRPSAEAQCLDVTATGISFACRMPIHAGASVTLWLSGSGWQRPDGVRWTPVSVEVVNSSHEDGFWLCSCRFQDTQASAVRALGHAWAQAGRTPLWRGEPAMAAGTANVGRPLAELLRPPPGAGLIFQHEGPISLESLQAVSDQIRHSLVLESVPANIASSAWAVASELLRNAQMHGCSTQEPPDASEAVAVPHCAVAVALCDRAIPGRTPTGAWVGCASVVRTTQLPGLLPLMRGLHMLAPETVFSHFSNLMRTSSWSRRWNAPPVPRFGLLTLARESKSPVEAHAYSESPQNRHLARLVIGVRV